MSGKELRLQRRYGKVITIRLRPENNMIAELLKKEAEAIDKDGNKVFTGVSELIEGILIDYFDRKQG